MFVVIEKGYKMFVQSVLTYYIYIHKKICIYKYTSLVLEYRIEGI